MSQTLARDPIAIVGIGCRLPGATTPAAFWELLAAGRDEIREIPADRFDLDASGTPTNKREFIRFPRKWGFPDGMTVDAEGLLWVAHWGGGCISRFTPEGQRQRWIELPASQITNVVFAGDNLDRLFVTSAADGKPDEPLAGSLFEVDPGVRGLEPYRFAG